MNDHDEPVFLDPREQWVDLTLRDAASDVKGRLADVRPPPFEHHRSRGPQMLAVAAALVLIAAVGAFALVMRGGTANDGLETDVAVTPTVGPVPESNVKLFDLLDKADRAVTSIDRPGFLQPILDPDFGTVITRITDSGEGEFTVPLAPAIWNLDESKLLFYNTDANGTNTQQLVDARTFEVTDLDIDPEDIEEVYWSPLEANVLYYVQRDSNVLMRFDVGSTEPEPVHTFDGCDEVNSGIAPVPPALESAAGGGQRIVFGLVCVADGERSLIKYDLTANATSTFDRPEVGEGEVAPYPSPSAEYFVFTPATDRNDNPVLSVVFDADGQVIRDDLDIEETKFIVATDDQGRDVVVTTHFDRQVGTLVATDVVDGSAQTIVGPDTGYPSPTSGNRLGSPTFGNTSLVSVGIDNTQRAGETTALVGEVLLADLSKGAQGAVYRLAHHRAEPRDVGDGYFGDPFTSVSPSGDKVLFSSNWGGDTTDVYLVDVPRN